MHSVWVAVAMEKGGSSILFYYLAELANLKVKGERLRCETFYIQKLTKQQDCLKLLKLHRGFRECFPRNLLIDLQYKLSRPVSERGPADSRAANPRTANPWTAAGHGVPINQYGFPPPNQPELGGFQNNDQGNAILAKASSRCFWLGVIVVAVGVFDFVLTVIPMLKGQSGSSSGVERALSLLNTVLLILIGSTGIYAGRKQDLLSAKLFMISIGLYLLLAIILWILQMVFLGKWDCVAAVREETTCSDYLREAECMNKQPVCVWNTNVCDDQAVELCDRYIKFQRMVLLLVAVCSICYIGCCYTVARDNMRAVRSNYNQQRMQQEAMAIQATDPQYAQQNSHFAVRLTDFSWSPIASWRWEFDEHINVLELRAFLVGLRWVLSCSSSCLCRRRFLLDSKVVLGALRKGRSSSYQLLLLLRVVAAFALASGLLLDAHLKPNVRRRYLGAADSFLRWVEFNCLGPALHSTEDLDEALVDFIYFSWAEKEGRGRQAAVNAVYGVIMLNPRLREKLVLAKLALTGWKKLCPVVSFPPLSWNQVLAIIFILLSRRKVTAAVAVLLAFESLLRIGELFALRVSDVIFGEHHAWGMPPCLVLRLRSAKGGDNQSVEVRSFLLRKLLASLVLGRRSEVLVFPGSAGSLSRDFCDALLSLGLYSQGYVFHSLRHEGAALASLRRDPFLDIMHRLRHKDTKTTFTYLQACKALLGANGSPPLVLALARVTVPNLSRLFSL
eukprot:g76969.t1